MKLPTALPALTRPAAISLICLGGLIAPVSPLHAQDISLNGVALDTIDDNRFFTRVGGTVRDDVSYEGLTAGQTYTLAAQLQNMTTGEPTGEMAFHTFTPDAPSGTASIELPVPQNRTDFNIDYVVFVNLYEGEVGAGSVEDATVLATLEDTSNMDQTIQSHAIQAITVTAADAADGDDALPPEGGTILATVDYVNLVEGYKYALWGQLLTPSGQGIGIYANAPEFIPEEKNGSLTMEFTVPEGYDGIRLVPAIGLFHHNRVEVGEDGLLSYLPDAPNPVMIASDPTVGAAEQTVDIGTPFEEQPQ